MTVVSSYVFFRKKKCRSDRVFNTKYKTLAIPDETGTGEGTFLVCRDCLCVITSENEKIEINGSHVHGFTNPHGMFFDIGCFSSAPGCAYSDLSSDEFTWFKGFSWRVAFCRKCSAHLGWLFTSDSSQFNGLILTRLIPLGFLSSEGDKK